MKQILDLIKTEQQRLEYSLNRVCRHFRFAFLQLANNVRQQAEKIKKQSMEEILTISLPFSDKSKHLREKLNNTIEFKQILMNSQMELVKSMQMTEQQQAKAKENFNLICDYKKRKDLSINGKDLYSLETCKHLAKRTFKKTAVDVYELMAATDIQFKESIKVGCLGGGPGSDLLGVITNLVERDYKKFQCCVLDYNWDKWYEVSRDLQKIFVAECKKIKKNIDLTVIWKKLDLANKSAGQEILKHNFDIVTCCWALNQEFFQRQLWSQLIEHKSTFYLIVDGDQFPIQYIADICHENKRKHLYCPYENPRSILIFQE